MIKKNLPRLSTIFALIVLMVVSLSGAAADNTQQQCIESPLRDGPCPNLIYSSFKTNLDNVLFCLCKNDKHPLLQLLQNIENEQQLKLVRTLVSQHRLTQTELVALLKTVND